MIRLFLVLLANWLGEIMKIFISNDMEGLAGITSAKQQFEEIALFRQALHTQLSWVIEGVQQSEQNPKIEEITICDAHGEGTNLSFFELSQMDPRISLVSGSPRDSFMMSTLDSSYQLAIFVGYHAGHGEIAANLDHSFSGRTIENIYINNILMNEATVNAAYAGEWGVPVGLIIGDSGLQKQLAQREQLMWCEFVTTKISLSRTAAKFIPQKQVREETHTAVKKVLDSNKKPPLYQLEAPFRLRLEFKSTDMADQVSRAPHVIRQDGRNIELVLSSMREVENAISAFTVLAAL